MTDLHEAAEHVRAETYLHKPTNKRYVTQYKH